MKNLMTILTLALISTSAHASNWNCKIDVATTNNNPSVSPAAAVLHYAGQDSVSVTVNGVTAQLKSDNSALYADFSNDKKDPGTAYRWQDWSSWYSEFKPAFFKKLGAKQGAYYLNGVFLNSAFKTPGSTAPHFIQFGMNQGKTYWAPTYYCHQI